MNNIVLLMTACINPNGMTSTAVQDAALRRRQYLDAVRFYLETTPFRILFVENSGEDITPYFAAEVIAGRIEVITCRCNDFDRRLGKGYGEGLVVREALANAHSLRDDCLIVKVSGRHKVQNVNSIVRWSLRLTHRPHDVVVCDVNRRTHGANSDLFIASRSFFMLLADGVAQIDESRGVWFEHALYATVERHIRAGGEFVSLPIPLDQIGQSGSMGTPLARPTLKMRLQCAAKAVLFYFNLLKIS